VPFFPLRVEEHQNTDLGCENAPAHKQTQREFKLCPLRPSKTDMRELASIFSLSAANSGLAHCDKEHPHGGDDSSIPTTQRQHELQRELPVITCP
jgi:hypothetical protein